MNVTLPLEVTPERLLSSTVPDADASAGESLWAAATDYAAGALAVRTETRRRYECIVPGVNSTPPESAPDRWLEMGASNQHAMFDYNSDQATEAASPLTVVLKPGKRIDSVYLDGVRAHQLTATLRVGGAVVYGPQVRNMNGRRTRSWSQYFFGEFNFIDAVVLQDLPLYANAELEITLTRAGGPVRCTRLVVGRKEHIGCAEWNPVSDVLDFSKIERDDWGNAQLRPARTVPITQQRLVLDTPLISGVYELRSSLQGKAAVWSALDDRTESPYFRPLLLFGIFRRMRMDISNLHFVYIDLDLEAI